MNLEHRRSRRRQLCLEALVFHRLQGLIPVNILDINAEGAFIGAERLALPLRALVTLTFALDTGDTPVGLVHWLYHRTFWAIGDNCYLQDLYVSPDARGGGHGRALIEHVAAEARSHQATRLYWNTHETNATARRLYDAVAVRSGFIQYRKALE